MNIDKLLKRELKVLAKRLGVEFNSNTTKPELIDSLKTIDEKIVSSEIDYLFGKKKTNRPDIFKILGIILSLGIFTIALLNYLDKSNEIDCDKYEIEEFSDSTSYNVLLLDLLDYSSCNSYADCEAEIAKRIDKVNKNSHIPIRVRIEKCKSIDLGILNLENAKQVAKKTNSNLVIYGGIEGSSADSLIVNLSYATNPNDTISLKGIVGKESQFWIKSIFDILTITKLKEIEDVIYWNLAIRSVKEGTKDGAIRQKKYLNLISSTNKRDYSNAKLIEGITLLFEENWISAKEAFTESIKRDSLNPFPYYERSLLNVALSNPKEAVIDFQYHKILSLIGTSYLDTLSLPNIIQYRKSENFPLNMLSESIKENNLAFGCTYLLKTLYKYRDLEIYDQIIIDYCIENGFKNQVESILEMKITEIKRNSPN